MTAVSIDDMFDDAMRIVVQHQSGSIDVDVVPRLFPSGQGFEGAGAGGHAEDFFRPVGHRHQVTVFFFRQTEGLLQVEGHHVRQRGCFVELLGDDL